MHDELIDKLLESRGIKTKEEKEKFLNPNYENGLFDPFLMQDMERACVRIFEAMEAHEKIVIFSDYDCDGIPGGVILHDFFKKINYNNFTNYIPDRHTEGYGLSIDAIKVFESEGVKLIITVDLGTTNVAEINEAQILGIDVIVTDHHIPPEVLPSAFAILNPKLGNYPDPMLCGAGVAFKLVQGMVNKYGEYYKIKVGWEKWLLDMAGLGTIADMVPLVNENRTLAYFGLSVLRRSPRPGLQKLLSISKIDQENINEDDVGFMIAPRINVAGRMDSPRRAFAMLASTDVGIGNEEATFLSKLNDERKSIVAKIMKDVHKTISKREEKEIIVIGNPSWRVGLLGLVASKIVETYNVSAFVWGREGTEDGAYIKGSTRSNGNLHVHDLMESVKDIFEDFGGHEQAGGFSISETNIHILEEKLLENFEKNNRLIKEDLKIDAELSPDNVDEKLMRSILKLAPFGMGNPKPVFVFKNVLLADVALFGKEKNHLKILIARENSGNGKPLEAIAFFKTTEDFKINLKKGERVNIVGNLEQSFFGMSSIRLRIVDIV